MRMRGGTTLYEEVWRHVSTSFADSRCRMSISNKHGLHCWDSAALPNKLCRFKTLRCFFAFIPMFAQFCTCTVLSFQFISSLIDFCNSSIARQTSVSSKETLIASFQTCQSNPQVFKLANACYILLQLTTSVVAGKIQYISIMQWPCAKPFLVARHDYSKRTSTAFAWKAQPSIATGGSWWKSPPDRQIRKLRKLPQSTNFPWSKFMYIW